MNIKKLVFLLLPILISGNILGQCPQGDVVLETQADVDSFAALYPNCIDIEGNLRIGTTPSSPSTNINDLNPLNQITAVGQDLLVLGTTDLDNLNGLQNISFVGNHITINSNGLNSLNGLEGLTSVEGGLDIWYNHSLSDLSGLGSITSIEGNLRIWYNENLNNLSGLENLTSIGNNLDVSYHTNLNSLAGLQNLISIGNDLDIAHNVNLNNSSGLESLTSIGRHLIVKNNMILNTLNILENLMPIGNGIYIHENPMLSICHVSTICNHLENDGESNIYDNAPDCNSVEEILTLCMVSTTTPDYQSDIMIFPNPSRGIFTVQGIPAGTYQILNTSGQIIQEGGMKNDISLDISDVVQGVYFISVTIDNETFVRRVVKM